MVDFTHPLPTLFIWLLNVWKAQHVNVNETFLNGDMNQEVFVYHFCSLPDVKRRCKVYKLHNTMHGLRQAPLHGSKNYVSALLKKENSNSYALITMYL